MLYILRLITALLILSIISACGGGGGGGGGGGSSGGGGGNPAGIQQFNGTISPAWVVSDAAANVYRTAEYDNQWGLEAIHAAEAYAALNQNGKTVAGDNIKVAQRLHMNTEYDDDE